jgi:hypothetical protein
VSQSENVLLVRLVVVGALAAYSGVLFMLFSRRRWTQVWMFVVADSALAWYRTFAWFMLTFERPDFYEHIPFWGWHILVPQFLQTFVMWSLAFVVVNNGSGRKTTD